MKQIKKDMLWVVLLNEDGSFYDQKLVGFRGRKNRHSVDFKVTPSVLGVIKYICVDGQFAVVDRPIQYFPGSDIIPRFNKGSISKIDKRKKLK
jgi:hypothetical protein